MKNTAKMLAIGVAVALSLSACSPAVPAPVPSTPGELRTVNVAAVPVVDVAALYVGEKQGFFAEEGLKLNIEFGPGSAAMIPGLINGQYDFLYGGSVNILQATDKGLPVEIIGVGGRSTGVQGKDHGGTLVLPNSSIQGPADLEGKTVAVNALKGLHQVALYASVKNAGGDPTKVNFVEIPLADMGAALDSGQVDAIATAEPFKGIAMAKGYRLIASQYVDIDPNFVSALYVAADTFIAANPDLVSAFTRALEKSTTYAGANSDAVRAELTNFTKIDPAVIPTMILTKFQWGLTEANIRKIADATADAGALSDPAKATAAAMKYLNK